MFRTLMQLLAFRNRSGCRGSFGIISQRTWTWTWTWTSTWTWTWTWRKVFPEHFACQKLISTTNVMQKQTFPLEISCRHFICLPEQLKCLPKTQQIIKMFSTSTKPRFQQLLYFQRCRSRTVCTSAKKSSRGISFLTRDRISHEGILTRNLISHEGNSHEEILTRN